MEKRSMGICFGASTVKVVEIVSNGSGTSHVSRAVSREHSSDPKSVFSTLREEWLQDSVDVNFAAATGGKFRNALHIATIAEPEAIEYALEFLRDSGQMRESFGAVASLGAESFVVYILNPMGQIISVEAGNKCASGTGEFFLQQLGRMNITPDDAVRLANGSEPYRVSGRCSVFCKSDCTHALNKGLPVGSVTAGLCAMMADKVLDLLEKLPSRRIIAIGGVTQNAVIMDILRAKLDCLLIPPHADVFEALGAAYYARKHQVAWRSDFVSSTQENKSAFAFLPPLERGSDLVQFERGKRGDAHAGDECIVGLDVGSTTTKAAVVRLEDNAILASVYLRTNGNPIHASRECYSDLYRQIQQPIRIIGLGTTGSGRQIAGLHAGTDAVINEILAHAAGAAHFDPSVDTIFEIGGQDAKYTYLTNGVACDYAMNEACSAGTGSFLEEAAKESLRIDYREIGSVALQATRAPNFNSQCAAFIGSDIKTAVQEGISREEIVAGLVYSICMNYMNRVKGLRPVGKTVFMQGGVCYNRAVPLAMAVLLGRKIVVPPDPGLVGAFGVALEVKDRIRKNLLAPKEFDLAELAARDVQYGKPFNCSGGTEKCDRRCSIATLIVDDRKYPFGGACNKYYNLAHHISYEEVPDIAKERQVILFENKAGSVTSNSHKKIGISRSFLTNLFHPLFFHYFSELGFEIVLSDNVDPDGIKRRRTSWCYPGEIAHGCFENLRKKNLDYLFLPRIEKLHVENSSSSKTECKNTCLLLRSEAACLKSAFRDVPCDSEIISPVINFSEGLGSQERVFIEIGRQIGKGSADCSRAFRGAVRAQEKFQESLRESGRMALEDLKSDPASFGIVVFGRPYNAFAKEANLGIPAKFASQGIATLTWDCLPYEEEACEDGMNWAIGENLMRAARFVEKHPQLYGVYITNFSCGPDSFLLGYFREIMKAKPTLTLELDSHTADAGINTRIEAFLEIIRKQRALGYEKKQDPPPFMHARIEQTKRDATFVTSQGERLSLKDPRVRIVFPSMGKLGAESLAAAMSGSGYRAEALPVYESDVLDLGRENTLGKECLPLMLVTGGLLQHLKERKEDECVAYFMPNCGGGCRFAQYNVFLRKLIIRNRISNVGLLTLNSEKGYAGLGLGTMLSMVKAVIVSDIMDDIRNSLRVLAVDWEAAQKVFEEEWGNILSCFSANVADDLYAILKVSAKRLAQIPLRYSIAEAKIALLHGEIFVRRDYFSCQSLVERLAQRDIIVHRAHVYEWLLYCDHLVTQRQIGSEVSLGRYLGSHMKIRVEQFLEKRIKAILAESGLYRYEPVDMHKILSYGRRFFDSRHGGESLLVVGSFFKDILHSVHGLISIGPFTCMAARVVESILSAECTMETKRSLDNGSLDRRLERLDITTLPFLAIESDGNPFPQVMESRIDAFCLQLERVHKTLRDHVPD